MPTLKSFESAKVMMYFGDHPPPHVHVMLRDRRECTVDLVTFEITGAVAEREIRDALTWISNNLNFLQQEWRRYNL